MFCVRSLPLECEEGEGTCFVGEKKGKEIQEVVIVTFKGFSIEKAWVWALC